MITETKIYKNCIEIVADHLLDFEVETLQKLNKNVKINWHYGDNILITFPV